MKFFRYGLGSLAGLAVLAALFFPQFTQWSRPYFYHALLTLSGNAPKSLNGPVAIVVVENQSLQEVMKAVAKIQPGVVALDPSLWANNPEALTPNTLALLGKIPVVLGWKTEPVPGQKSTPLPAPLARFPILDGMIDAKSFPKYNFGAGPTISNWPANVSVGFVSPVNSPVFEIQVLARGSMGLIPSLSFEALRRSQRITQERLAYVESIGLLLGPKITVPITREGLVPLRFGKTPVFSVANLLEFAANLTGRIVLVTSSQNKISMVNGTYLEAETWAIFLEDAVSQTIPRIPASANWLSLIVGLLGIAALILVMSVGMNDVGIIGLCLGLALIYPLASLGFFLGANWWLPPENPFFAILWAGFGALCWKDRLPPLPVKMVKASAPSLSSTISTIPSTRKSQAITTPLALLGHPTPIPNDPPKPSKPVVQDPNMERDAQGGLLRIGKYRIIRKMGSGAAGDVFEGIDTQMSRRVAIKAMTRGAQLHFDHAHERFVIEAKAAGSLNHPNINTIYDFGTISNVSFMVLEYLDGLTLSQWMRTHTPPLPFEIGEWIRQICSALDYAHEHRVIHRDLKPSNLMVVDQDQTIKLLDFGVAKLEDVMLTQAGMTVGTPSYMSPEQLQGEKVSASSDQYALAVVIYQLLSYRLPYVGTRIPEICNRILKHELVPLTEANAALPGAYWKVLEVALSKAPEERYPNCTALFESLESVWRSHQSSTLN